ncbi:MAG: MoaD/ThiS family protein [Deltaproteobacteria bacterium]|nr:MoaD/ThiS family protein [Deltaproteobacteria bacterium]
MTVEFVGPMRRPWKERRRLLEVDGGSTVDRVVASLGYDARERKHFAFLVNGVKARPDEPLAADDLLAVLLMVGGG